MVFRIHILFLLDLNESQTAIFKTLTFSYRFSSICMEVEIPCMVVQMKLG